MNRLNRTALLSLCLLPATLMWAKDPDITLRTGIYDSAGPGNTCTISVGGTPGTYVTVDCGFGEVEYEIKQATFDSTTQTLNGTPISCQVSKEGLIKIYQDEDCELDYINAEGCYLEWMEFADPSKLRIVNFNHNNLERLDLSDFTALEVAYLSDNPYNKAPLTIGKNHPQLALLEINAVYNIDPDFDIDTYPKLTVLDAFAVPGITKITPSGCPGLVLLSIDCTNVSELDVTKNPSLVILNISETAIRDIDLSGCPNLQELYMVHQSDTYNPDVKFKSVDLTKLPELYYFFAAGNELKSIDVSKNPKINHLWVQYNELTDIDISNNPDIQSLRLEQNYFDFVTLPADRETFNEYEYAQHPFKVPVELEVGKGLDLLSRINRPGTETVARLVSYERSAPYTPVPVDESLYTFANGILTVNTALPDSVSLELVNSDFTACSIPTTKFMVKNAADMGKPDLQMTFQTSLSAGQDINMCIAIEGASPETPKNLYVRQSDGSYLTVPVITAVMPDSPNVSFKSVGYGQVELYADMNERVAAVGIDGVPMYACDVTPMASLRQLRITGAGLYGLDLGYNRCLQKLVLTGNHFSQFSLDGVSGDYTKNTLSYLDISDNEISELTLSFKDAFEYFDVHSNRFTQLDFTNAERIWYLDVSHNNLESLKLNYLSSLRELNASYNNLTDYTAPETNVIEKADFSHNNFTYANLPARNGLSEQNFIYAPQAKIQISTRAPGIDLESQAVTIDGKPVVFAWYKTDGTKLTEGTQYTITDGRTRFLDTSVGEVHCVMTCAALPAFEEENALMTTDVLVSEMPTNVAATFRTAEEGTMELSLASHNDGDTIYIDWNGDGTNLVQYMLTTSYRLFSAITKAGADVKVYTYENENALSVFSIRGVKLDSFDGSNLNRLIALTVTDAGLSTMQFPDSPELSELSLAGNAFTEFNAAKFPNLRTLALTGSQLSTLDLTPCKSLELLAAARNQLTEITFPKDNPLWFLDLSDNKFTSYDLQQHKQLNQVSLSGNLLSEIDPSGLEFLRTLYIDHNYFTFATLPVPDSKWMVYTYANQAPVVPEIDGLTVDLSSQKEVDGTPTTYRWFIGVPTYNYETGEYEGEELVAGEEYTIENGVTTLESGYDKMICLMTNSVLPNVTLTTDLLNLSDIDTIEVDTVDADAVYFTLDGVRVTNPTSGLYIVIRGNKVTKELLK